MTLIRRRSSLALCHLVAYLVLVWYGCWYRPTWQHWLQSRNDLPSDTVYPAWIDGVESIPEQIAAGLNAPAVALAAVSLVPFETVLNTGASQELALHTLTAMYVPCLWYVIGKGIDARAQFRATAVSARAKALSLATIIGISAVGLVLLWSFAAGQRYVTCSLSMVWIIAAIMLLSARLHRSQP